MVQGWFQIVNDVHESAFSQVNSNSTSFSIVLLIYFYFGVFLFVCLLFCILVILQDA